jgi:hypothetical protein
MAGDGPGIQRISGDGITGRFVRDATNSAVLTVTVRCDGGRSATSKVEHAWSVHAITVELLGTTVVATPPAQRTDDGGGTFSAAFAAGAAAGAVTGRVVLTGQEATTRSFPDPDNPTTEFQPWRVEQAFQAVIEVDTAGPVVTVALIESQPTTEAQQTFTVFAADPIGIRATTWEVVGAAAIAGTAQPDGQFRMDFDWRRSTGAARSVPAPPQVPVRVRARDLAVPVGNEGVADLTLQDQVAPRVTITAPREGDVLPNDGTGATLTLSGTAEDFWSGVTAVEHRLDGGVWHPVGAPGAPATSLAWTMSTRIADFGLHRIEIRAQDAAGNWLAPPASVTCEVAAPVRTDRTDPLSATAYLADLLEFAGRSVSVPRNGAAQLSAAARRRLVATELGRVFHQRPLVPAGDETIGGERIDPVRAVVEVCQRVLDPGQRDLVAHWTFADGAGPTVDDATGNRFPAGAVPGSAPRWVPGRTGGSALRFDGAADELVVAEPGALTMSQAFSVVAWVRPETQVTGDYAAILAKEGEYLVGRSSDGVVGVAVANADPGWQWLNTGVRLEPDRWTHLAVVYDDGLLLVYRDGALAFRYAGQGRLGSVAPLLQDVRIAGRQALAAQFKGTIGDLRLYRGAVPAATLGLLHEGDTAPLASWPLTDETSGASLDEVTGRRLEPGTAGWDDGRAGRALSLAAGQQARVDDVQGLRLGAGDSDFTVCLWLRVTGAAAGAVLRKADGPDAHTPELALEPGATAVRFAVSTDANAVESTPPAALVADRWTHVAAVKDGRSLRLYLDGRPAAAQTLTGAVVANDGPITLGDDVGGPGFDGRLQGVELTGRALTDAEIAGRAADTARAYGRYLRTAYRTVLSLNGVSYDELRLVRSVADQAARDRLAGRLGIRLRPGRPDELDELFPPAGVVTPGWLESTFGLTDTTRPPGTVPVEPRVVVWRREALRAAWRQQDTAAGRNGEPLVDPALVAADEIVEASGLRAVRADRERWLRQRRDVLRGLRDAAAGPAEACAAMLDEAELPPARLAELAAGRAAGLPITDELAELHLTMADLNRLLVVRGLAEQPAPVLDDEDWADLERILVAVQRRAGLPAWKTAERTMLGGRPVILAPECFALRPRPAEEFDDRATLLLRRDLEDRLTGRVDQDRAVAGANAETTQQAETLALVPLRDALLPAVAALLRLPDSANEVSQALLIDVGATGSPPASRAMYGVEVVGGLLFALRTRRLEAGHPATTWTIVDPAGFDADWEWLSSYEGWRAAMLAFFYPETMLYPAFRPAGPGAQARSPAFGALLTELRRRDGTPAARIRAGLVAFTSQREATAGPIPAGYQPSPADPAAHRALNDAVGEHGPRPTVVQEVLYHVPLAVAVQCWRWGAFPDALDWFRLVYDDTAAPGARQVYAGLRAERNDPLTLSRSDEWLRDLNPHVLAGFHGGNPYTRFTVMAVAQCLLDFADAEFTKASGDAIARARSLYLTVDELLAGPETQPPAGGPRRLLPENPLLVYLRVRCANQLLKLRQGRNIAGMVRPADEDQVAGTGPVFDEQGTPVPPSRSRLRPTGYRYSALIERARRLVALAAQIEAAYLSAMERQDAETYRALEAGQHLAVAQQGIRLQELRLTEATDAQQLALRRQRRIEIQQATYDDWLEAGPSAWERATLGAYIAGGTARATAAALQAAAAITVQAYGMAPAIAIPATSAAASAVLATYTGTTIAGAVASGLAAAADATAQSASLQASLERRREQWELEKNLADQDYLIGDQEKTMADDHRAIVVQEVTVATLQNDNAKAIADYLATKFLNVELYEWMTGVLGDVYASLLQQATTVALTAQQQLGFERQVQSPAFIRDDYWTPPAQDGETEPADRRGLTGTARLLRDVEQLDQYAFENNRRKLNLSHTFSLASIAPLEFQRFRTTGTLPFTTSLQHFDQLLPGDYLRLIRQVRVSVLALVPPAQGIRASLTASGLSRVVVKQESFQTVLVRRDPERVALTSPANATGIFELDTQADLLLPFEAMGVDTAWEFQLPRPANPIDPDSIADVLVTVEYTALHDPDYRRQVIDRLNDTVSAERSYSLRTDFPDAWYDLCNPADPAAPRVTLRTRPGDFPVNLADLEIQQVLLYLAPAADGDLDPIDVDLALRPGGAAGGAPPLGGPASTAPDGTVSTRRGNGSPWLTLQGMPPAGEWTLEFGPGTAARFADGTLVDVLLVLSVTGHPPPWPTW